MLTYGAYRLQPRKASLLASVVPSAAQAWPKKVVFIRHGEKPPRAEDDGALSAAGRTHAQDWAEFFTTARKRKYDPVGPLVGADVALFAMKQTSGARSSGQAYSNRPFQTISPLADKLGVAISADYTVDQVAEVAASVAQCGASKVALVCWEHKAIPHIVNEMFISLGSRRSWTRGSPQALFWDRSFKGSDNSIDYDTVWVLDPQKRTLTAHTGCHVGDASAEQKIFASLAL